ncbi:hypothetical protein HAX54_015382 [Datura stramonium]|uniref:BTB domain-containing protein n=1 Tax=Datura stramonium TaxID=4076 RepID=A0ABS8TRT0_DATST|nr:hypothetical protein [Datura stramonium]
MRFPSNIFEETKKHESKVAELEHLLIIQDKSPVNRTGPFLANLMLSIFRPLREKRRFSNKRCGLRMIKDANGNWILKKNDIVEATCNYFEDLFSSIEESAELSAFDNIPALITTPEGNASLVLSLPSNEVVQIVSLDLIV